jgi:serine/threonine-protein kinase
MTPVETTTPPFELDLLGSVELRRSDGTAVGAVIAQPKRLAVLAYLAVARPRGFHQRDKLLALFWPELDQERARAAMSQAIYTLRRSLGADAIVTRGSTDVAIATGVVQTDVAAFEAAVTGSEWEKAFGLYRGELLDGFHVAGAAGFTEWLDSERSRLRDAARNAAHQLSQRAEKAGAAADAAVWARKAFTLAPYDEAELRRLLALLHAANDITGAAQ